MPGVTQHHPHTFYKFPDLTDRERGTVHTTPTSAAATQFTSQATGATSLLLLLWRCTNTKEYHSRVSARGGMSSLCSLHLMFTFLVNKHVSSVLTLSMGAGMEDENVQSKCKV